MRRMRLVTGLVGGVMNAMLVMPAVAYDEPWVAGAELGAGYDSNAGNSGIEQDRRGDAFIEAAGRVNRLYPAGHFFSLELEGALRGRYYRDYDDLSLAAPELAGRVNFRPAAGFRTPTLTAELAAGYREYASRLRDGGYYRSGLTLTQPLNTRLTARINASYNRRLADNDVFDYEFYSVGATLDWSPAERLVIYGGATRREGGLVATSRDDADVKSAARAWLADDAIVDPDEQQLAYRLDTSADRYLLGINYRLTGGVSLDGRLVYQEASSYGGFSYRRSNFMAGLLVDF